MGNCFVQLSETISLIASDDTWIEGNAIHQLHNTAELPGMHRIVAMPDLHPGRGYAVGAAFFSVGRLYPALVGNDIGCGMALWQTGLNAGKASADRLDKRLGNLDVPLGSAWQDEIDRLAPAGVGHHDALGTIGGGNHFAELQQVDEVHDAAALDALGIATRELLLLVHTGSRGLGQAILTEHIGQFGHRGLAEDEAEAYLARHAQALAFAHANRELVALRMLDRLCSGDGHRILDVHHNYVAPAMVNGVRGWLHRKGATPSDAGPVVIPGSRGDFSYLVQPQPDASSLYSLAHGAGRKWMRSECKDRLVKRFSVDQLRRTKLNSHVICEDRDLIYEEAPDAYKPIDSVVGALHDAGLVTIIARLKPVLTYKTRGRCCE